MSNKLYVGNLSFQMNEEDLRDAFAEMGAVKSVKIVKDFETGRSKGFGFVEMENQDDMENCIEVFNGKEVGGRSLKVSVAIERERSNDQRRSGGFNKRNNNRY